MKNYDIELANGPDNFTVSVKEVAYTELSDGAYLMYDSDNKLIFSAPVDSVLYINES